MSLCRDSATKQPTDKKLPIYNEARDLPKALSVLRIESYCDRPKLLALPGEIRNQIWRLVVVAPDKFYRRHKAGCPWFAHRSLYTDLPAHVRSESQSFQAYPSFLPADSLNAMYAACYKGCLVRNALELLCVNKQIAAEAGSIFLTETTFCFSCPEKLEAIVDVLTPEARAQIRHVAFENGKDLYPPWRYLRPREDASIRALDSLPGLHSLSISPRMLHGLGSGVTWNWLLRLRTLTLSLLLEVPLDVSGACPYICINRKYDLPRCFKDLDGKGAFPAVPCEEAECQSTIETISLCAELMADTRNGLGKAMLYVCLGWILRRKPTHSKHDNLKFKVDLGGDTRETVDLLGLRESIESEPRLGPPARCKQRKVTYAEDLDLGDCLPHETGSKTTRPRQRDRLCASEQSTPISRRSKVPRHYHEFSGPSDTSEATAEQVTGPSERATRRSMLLKERELHNARIAQSERNARKNAIKKSKREQEQEKKSCRRREGRRK